MNNYTPRQSLVLISYGVILGLLMGGLIWTVASPPRGKPVTLSTQPSDQLISIYISGEVLHPGVYNLPAGSRVKDAIEIAGGFLSTADISLVNQAEVVIDSTHINIIPKNTTESYKSLLIDINSASGAELETLPGIGTVFAKNIVDYRLENGPFLTIEEIQKVTGIGPQTYEKIKNLITIGK